MLEYSKLFDILEYSKLLYDILEYSKLLSRYFFLYKILGYTT